MSYSDDLETAALKFNKGISSTYVAKNYFFNYSSSKNRLKKLEVAIINYNANKDTKKKLELYKMVGTLYSEYNTKFNKSLSEVKEFDFSKSEKDTSLKETLLKTLKNINNMVSDTITRLNTGT